MYVFKEKAYLIFNRR